MNTDIIITKPSVQVNTRIRPTVIFYGKHKFYSTFLGIVHIFYCFSFDVLDLFFDFLFFDFFAAANPKLPSFLPRA